MNLISTSIDISGEHYSTYNKCNTMEIQIKSVAFPSPNEQTKNGLLFNFNPIQDGGRGGKKSLHPPTSFSSVTSGKVGISSQNFLTFTFNLFPTLP